MGTTTYAIPGDAEQKKMCKICLGRYFKALVSANRDGREMTDEWKYEDPADGEDPPGYCECCRNKFGGYDPAYRRPYAGRAGKYVCTICA